MIDLKERTRDDLYLVAKHRNELNRALRELPRDTERHVRKSAQAQLREADIHLSRAIARALSAGWPRDALTSVGLPVDLAVIRATRAFMVSIAAAAIVLEVGCAIVPFWWAVGMAGVAYVVLRELERRADKPLFARYTELVGQLRQQQPWWERTRGSG